MSWEFDEHDKPNVFRKIYLWWKHEGRFLHKDFIWGVENLIKWFPIIWKDRNWGYQYIYDILQTKLELQAKYIGGNDRHERAKRDAQIMMTCVKLIDNIKNDEYGTEYLNYYVAKVRFVPTKYEGKDMFEMVSDEISERFDDYFKKYPRTYKQVMATDYSKSGWSSDIKDSKQGIAMLMARENEAKAKRILFKILNDNIEKFWD